MSEDARARVSRSTTPAFTSARSGLLQRKCACGGTPGVDGECAACRAKRLGLQRQAASPATPATVSPIVHEVLRSPGQSLDAGTRAFMEPRFGHDFSRVRVHTDAKAAESARAVNALAYTVGRDVVFGAGQYAPEASTGKRLLAHELTHTIQQASGSTGGGRQNPQLQRATGDRHGQPVNYASRIKDVQMTPISLTIDPGKIVRRIEGNDLVVTLNEKLMILGAADITDGPDTDKFTFGFFQLLRPYNVYQATYHSLKKGGDYEINASQELRSKGPLIDPPDESKDHMWMRKEDFNYRLESYEKSGKVTYASVYWYDQPSKLFFRHPYIKNDEVFLTGVAWQDFFFTTFSVQYPDGTIHHLKSFYWTIRYCEKFPRTTQDPSNPNVYHITPPVSSAPHVDFGDVIDGAPNEPGIDQMGKRTEVTANKESRRIIAGTPVEGPGKFNIVCPIPGI